MDIKERVKAEILSVDEAAHGVLVRYYTDVLKEHYETVERPARYENVRAGRPNDTEEEVQAYIDAHYKMGHIVLVPVRQGMAQQEVLDEINARANFYWLSEMERLRGPAPDFSVASDLIGKELAVTSPPPPIPPAGLIETVA